MVGISIHAEEIGHQFGQEILRQQPPGDESYPGAPRMPQPLHYDPANSQEPGNSHRPALLNAQPMGFYAPAQGMPYKTSLTKPPWPINSMVVVVVSFFLLCP